jgi:PTS system cellobiose-specific IIB component
MGRQIAETVGTFNEEVAVTQVFVVCAAGASSTFLARRLSDLASAVGISWSFTPSPVDLIPADSSAIVAVTSHVATPEVLESLSSKKIRHLVLPDTVRGGFGAEEALSAIISAVGKNSGRTDTISKPALVEGTI